MGELSKYRENFYHLSWALIFKRTFAGQHHFFKHNNPCEHELRLIKLKLLEMEMVFGIGLILGLL